MDTPASCQGRGPTLTHLGVESGTWRRPSLMRPLPPDREGWDMIKVESLTKKYGGFPAVDDVSFAALPGRVTGFLGPNGAGKSTTMRIVVGLTPTSSGTATI